MTCYLIVVKSSGTGLTATRDYTDRLYEEWTQQSIRSSLPFDQQRSIVIVLAMENRQLSVHAGQALLQSSDLTAQTIDQKLVAPHFIPFAKAGNYPDGVKSLLSHMSEWITTHEQSANIPSAEQTVEPQVLPPATAEPDFAIAQAPPSPQSASMAEGLAAPEVPALLPSPFITWPLAIAGALVMAGLFTLLIL